jgi:hypothetical protein
MKPLKIDNATYGDWTRYECQEHGVFNLSTTLSKTLLLHPHGLRNVAEYLRNTANRKDVICTYDVGIT